MPPRATWKGHLKFSLIRIPVRAYTASESGSRVSFSQVHKETQKKPKQVMMVDGEVVPRTELVKGYEYEKDKFVLFDQDEIDKVKVQSTGTIDIEQFSDAEELTPLMLDTTYYVGPDGKVADEPYRVLRDALRESGKVGIGRVVMFGRENLVALAPFENGIAMTKLRYADEIRKPDTYFEDVSDEDAPEEQVKLAVQLIGQLTKEFDHEAFVDRYQEALMNMIQAKLSGAEPVAVQEDEAAQVFSFMDALKQSVSAAGEAEQTEPTEAEDAAAEQKKTQKKPRAKSVKKKTTRKSKTA